MLAAGGRDGFYAGPVAAGDRGLLARRSAASSRSPTWPATAREWVEPISTTYRGHTVWELPPNGQGLAALEMLNILEGYDLKAMGRDNPDLWHLLVEAKKLAFEDRARYYADPAFADVPVAGAARQGVRARGRRARDRHGAGAAGDSSRATPRSRHGDTTYLVAADAERQDGLASSRATTPASAPATSCPSSGFGIQDRGALFTLDPATPTPWRPASGRSTRSSRRS